MGKADHWYMKWSTCYYYPKVVYDKGESRKFMFMPDNKSDPKHEQTTQNQKQSEVSITVKGIICTKHGNDNKTAYH